MLVPYPMELVTNAVHVPKVIMEMGLFVTVRDILSTQLLKVRETENPFSYSVSTIG